jgi:hypothetical protein
MIVMLDVTTNTLVGPFETEEAAVEFKLNASEEINDPDQQLDLYELTSPLQWMLDNFTSVSLVDEAPNTNIAPASTIELV